MTGNRHNKPYKSYKPYTLRVAWPGKTRISIAAIVTLMSIKFIFPWHDTSGYWLSLSGITIFFLFSWWQGNHLTKLLWKVIGIISRNVHRNYQRRSTRQSTQHSVDVPSTAHELNPDIADNTTQKTAPDSEPTASKAPASSASDSTQELPILSSRYERYGTLRDHQVDTYATVVLHVTEAITPQLPWTTILSFLQRFGVRAHSIRIIAITNNGSNTDANNRQGFFISLTVSLYDNWERVQVLKLFADDVNDTNATNSTYPAHHSDHISIRTMEDNLTPAEQDNHKKSIHKLIRLTENAMRRLQEDLQEHGWITHLIPRHEIPPLFSTDKISTEKLSYLEMTDSVATAYTIMPSQLSSALETIAQFSYPHITTIIDIRPDAENSTLSHAVHDTNNIYIGAACLIISPSPLPRKNPLYGMFKLRGYYHNITDIFSFSGIEKLPFTQKLPYRELITVNWDYPTNTPSFTRT